MRGRVVEAGTSQDIAGADVALSGVPTVLTDESGAFRIGGVPAGRHILRVAAPGYRSVTRVLLVTHDTTLVIGLAPAPFALDTLEVRAPRITIRGTVKDAGSGRELVDVSVVMGDRQVLTNPAGGFKLGHIPAGVPLPLSLSDFGYLPLDTTVTVHRDTTLALVLRPDSVMRRMVAVQVARLQRRAKPFHSALMPVLDRKELVDRDGGSALEMVKEKYGVLLNRIKRNGCMLINDVETTSVDGGLQELAFLAPAELQRVEVLDVQGHDELRVYTRAYMRTMVGRHAHLPTPTYVSHSICY